MLRRGTLSLIWLSVRHNIIYADATNEGQDKTAGKTAGSRHEVFDLDYAVGSSRFCWRGESWQHICVSSNRSTPVESTTRLSDKVRLDSIENQNGLLESDFSSYGHSLETSLIRYSPPTRTRTATSANLLPQMAAEYVGSPP